MSRFSLFLCHGSSLQVPSGLRGQAHLKVWGNRHLAEGGYIFHNYTTITVESKGTAVFIQTDKPVYKPKHRGSHGAPPAKESVRENQNIV